MKASGANALDLQEFVRSSTNYYNQIFTSSNPEKTEYKSHSPQSKLIFFNNRQHHTNNVNGFKKPHQTSTPVPQRHSSKPDSIIERALNRKQISPGYHSNMATFLKSDGPFAIYDHSLRHAETETNPTVTDKVALAALHRYENELLRLQQLREAEKA